MKLLKILAFTGIALSCFLSCKKEKEAPPAYLGYDYFPDNIGHTITYKVVAITWDAFYIPPVVDTQYYFIKEVVESHYTDNEGQNTMRIERYVKTENSNSFVLKDVWAGNLTNTSAQKVEENVRFVKLSFPIAEGITWNGNIYNTYDKETYKYEDVYQPYTIGTLQFDSTVTVIQKDEQTLINRDYKVEVYARHIGMVYKRDWQIDTEVTGDITGGFDITYQAIAWE